MPGDRRRRDDLARQNNMPEFRTLLARKDAAHPRIARITLNRPERRNALNPRAYACRMGNRSRAT